MGDVRRVLSALNRQVHETSRVEWLHRIDDLKRDHPSMLIRETDKLIPQYVIKEIAEATEGHAVIVTGVGQHQMWAAQHYTFNDQCTLVSSGGAGAMGYEVPGAMGAQVGRPDKVVWSIAGDGGFQVSRMGCQGRCDLGPSGRRESGPPWSQCSAKMSALNELELRPEVSPRTASGRSRHAFLSTLPVVWPISGR